MSLRVRIWRSGTSPATRLEDSYRYLDITLFTQHVEVVRPDWPLAGTESSEHFP
jgi:hypothetical protein